MKPEHPKPAEPEAARAVLEYFLRHPSAADSLEGIARWRLMEQLVEKTVLETEDALRWLVDQGFVIEAARSHSGRIYSLNPEKRLAAEQLLQNPPQPEAK